MKLLCISDTHTRHRELDLIGVEVDVVVHAGDFMSTGYNAGELHDFLSWAENLIFDGVCRHFVMIAGNHDRIFEENPFLAKEIVDMYATNINYLQDEELVIDGIKFYGSPWTPEFCGWAFALPKDPRSAEERFARIPNNTDVIISHGPAFGILDKIVHPVSPNASKEHLGCKQLRDAIERVNPKLHICGHIHSSNGILDGYGEITTHINASCLDESYGFGNKQNYIEWEVK